MILRMILFASISLAALNGCSHTVYERQKDESNPNDQGMESKIKLEGPRAVMETKF